MKDLTSKLLLGLVATGLWANALRPAIQPTISHAQQNVPTVVPEVLRARSIEIVDSKGTVVAAIGDGENGGEIALVSRESGATNAWNAQNTASKGTWIDSSGLQIAEKIGNDRNAIELKCSTGDSYLSMWGRHPNPTTTVPWLSLGHWEDEGSRLSMFGDKGKESLDIQLTPKDSPLITLSNPDGKKQRMLKP